MKALRINNETRLTEEVLDETRTNEFEIVLKRECDNPKNDIRHYVEGTTVCFNCYYDELLKVARDKVPPSRRKKFLISQLSKRKEPLRFLNEFKDLIIDNQGYLNENEYNVALDYLNKIDELLQNSNLDITGKAELLLKLLYERRETQKNYDLREILQTVGLSVTQGEAIHIIRYLKSEEICEVYEHGDGAHLKINYKGIIRIEQGQPQKNNKKSLDELIHIIDVKFAELKVEVNLNATEMADMIEELTEEFRSFSKPSVVRVVKMRMTEYLLSTIVKDYTLKPGIKELVESIEDL